jgi:glycosyltransferase involved in cell wall biosynthesis
MRKFSVITPCFNAESFIQETIRSVTGQTLFQNGSALLEYIICDGGSKDNTVKIAEATLQNARNCEYRIISGPDCGMYDALVKGMQLITGDYCSYINAGDLYYSRSFEILSDILNDNRIKWITGLRVIINESSQIAGVRLPFKFKRSFIRKGYYGKILPFIQQESTFWRRELNQKIDFNYLRTLKLAGDYYLWTRFSEETELYIAESYLGAFRIHKGQKSENRTAYFKERKKFIHRAGISIITDLPGIFYEWLYFFGDYYKTKANKKTMVTYNFNTDKWELSY